MTDAVHPVFVFENHRPDVNSKGGVKISRIAARASSFGEAVALAEGQLPNLRLVATGGEAEALLGNVVVASGEAKKIA